VGFIIGGIFAFQIWGACIRGAYTQRSLLSEFYGIFISCSFEEGSKAIGLVYAANSNYMWLYKNSPYQNSHFANQKPSLMS